MSARKFQRRVLGKETAMKKEEQTPGRSALARTLRATGSVVAAESRAAVSVLTEI